MALSISNPRREIINNLRSDEKRNFKLQNTPGRSNVIISESGLYKVATRSDKPEARKFQDWVTRDVLPAIRKDGEYIQGEEKAKIVPSEGLPEIRLTFADCFCRAP